MTDRVRIIDDVDGNGTDAHFYGVHGDLVEGEGGHRHMGWDGVVVTDDLPAREVVDESPMEDLELWLREECEAIPGIDDLPSDRIAIPVIIDEFTERVD